VDFADQSVPPTAEAGAREQGARDLVALSGPGWGSTKDRASGMKGLGQPRGNDG